MSEITISKELVSEVLNINYDSIDIRNNVLYITYNVKKYFDGNVKEINLCEFIHKNCKEWALNKGFYWSINYDSKYVCVEILKGSINREDGEWNQSISKTEEEAIIKNCEWILKKHKG